MKAGHATQHLKAGNLSGYGHWKVADGATEVLIVLVCLLACCAIGSLWYDFLSTLIPVFCFARPFSTRYEDALRNFDTT